MTKTTYLLLTREGATSLLDIVQKDVAAPYCPTTRSYYRISPIYPVTPGAAVPPDASKAYSIGFFFYANAAIRLAELQRRLPTQDQNSLWFSHGLASILIISNDEGLIHRIEADYPTDLRAVEVWRVKDRRIEMLAPSLRPAAPFQPKDFRLNDYASLDLDTSALLTELQHSIAQAVSLAAQFVPAHLELYRRVVGQLNDDIQFLRFLQYPEDYDPPDSGDVELSSTPAARQKRINQLVDRIVQTNSALSYVVSQAYSGAAPIIERPSLFETYSLLGTGTAHLALFNFERYVQHVFAAHPVALALMNSYASAGTGVNVFKAPDSYERGRDAWQPYQGRLDSALKDMKPQAPRARFVFFSGRLGFQETITSVSAAMQLLQALDTARWSLMTMTHELTHAHARSILAAIFGGDDRDTIAEHRLEAFIDRYREFVSARGTFDSGHFSLQECLRFAIFNFVAWRKLGQDARPTQEDAKLKPSEIKKGLRDNWKLINEIMTQVLDYVYFYNRSKAVYLDLVWTSWATVPAVLETIDDYLARCITTLTVSEAGSIADRITRAVHTTQVRLKALAVVWPQSLLIGEAAARIEQPEMQKRLLRVCQPGIYLADIAHTFLVASRIHGQMIGPRARPDAYGYVYPLDTASWPDGPTTSPVAFVSDRLRRSMLPEADNQAVAMEHRTAWAFLTLACGPSEIRPCSTLTSDTTGR